MAFGMHIPALLFWSWVWIKPWMRDMAMGSSTVLLLALSWMAVEKYADGLQTLPLSDECARVPYGILWC